MAKVPPHDQLMNPTIQALHALGGSGTIEEINAKVIQLIDFSDEQLEQLHNPERGGQTEVEYRLRNGDRIIRRNARESFLDLP